MKSNPQSDNDGEQLRLVLREWVVDAPLPPRFQDQVWQRIGRAEARPASGFWAGLAHLIEVALPRPRIALAYMGVLLVLGVAAGSVAAQVRSSQVRTALSERYVQSIDPYRAEILPQ